MTIESDDEKFLYEVREWLTSAKGSAVGLSWHYVRMAALARLLDAAKRAFHTGREPEEAEVEAVAWALAYNVWPCTTPANRKRWADNHWQEHADNAHAALAASDAWRAKRLKEKA
jgi:hypothetical protein